MFHRNQSSFFPFILPEKNDSKDLIRDHFFLFLLHFVALNVLVEHLYWIEWIRISMVHWYMPWYNWNISKTWIGRRFRARFRILTIPKTSHAFVWFDSFVIQRSCSPTISLLFKQNNSKFMGSSLGHVKKQSSKLIAQVVRENLFRISFWWLASSTAVASWKFMMGPEKFSFELSMRNDDWCVILKFQNGPESDRTFSRMRWIWERWRGIRSMLLICLIKGNLQC